MSTTRRSIEEKSVSRRSNSYNIKVKTVNKELKDLIKQYEQKVKDLRQMRENQGKINQRKRSVQVNSRAKIEPNKKIFSKSLISEATVSDQSLIQELPKKKQRKILIKPFTALSSIEHPNDSFLNEIKTIDNPETNITNQSIVKTLQKNDSEKTTNRLARLSDPTLTSQKSKTNSFFLTFSDKNQQTDEPFYEILTERERLFNNKLEELCSEYDLKKKTLELQITTLRKENEKLNSFLSTYKADKEVKVQTPKTNHLNSEFCSKCRAFVNLNSDLKAKIDRLKMYLN